VWRVVDMELGKVRGVRGGGGCRVGGVVCGGMV